MNDIATILLSLSIALLSGLLLTRVASKLKLPAVTAYLVAGILIGPFCLGALGVNGLGLNNEQVESFAILSEVALGFIAFSMGNEFRISQLKKIWRLHLVV